MMDWTIAGSAQTPSQFTQGGRGDSLRFSATVAPADKDLGRDQNFTKYFMHVPGCESLNLILHPEVGQVLSYYSLGCIKEL